MSRLLPILAAALLATLLLLALRAHRTLLRGLPERIECTGPAEAFSRALADNLPPYRVAGTGSMAPYIPAAPAGADPLGTVVAYAVPGHGRFADVRRGTLCAYAPTWCAPGMTVLHQAAQRTSAGWLMTGLANARSDGPEPMTPTTFRAIVVRVYVWKS